MTQKLTEKIQEYRGLPENAGILLYLGECLEVEFVSHVDETTFCGLLDDSPDGKGKYHFSYKDIEHVIMPG